MTEGSLDQNRRRTERTRSARGPGQNPASISLFFLSLKGLPIEEGAPALAPAPPLPHFGRALLQPAGPCGALRPRPRRAQRAAVASVASRRRI